MEALAPVIVGAVLAALFGIFGAWLQSRREYSRWVRERRFDAFIAARSLIDRYEELAVGARELQELSGATPVDRAWVKRRVERETARLAEVRKSYIEAQTPLMILGPLAVIDAMRRAIDAIDAADSETQRRALQEMSAAMRKSLRLFK